MPSATSLASGACATAVGTAIVPAAGETARPAFAEIAAMAIAAAMHRPAIRIRDSSTCRVYCLRSVPEPLRAGPGPGEFEPDESSNAQKITLVVRDENAARLAAR